MKAIIAAVVFLLAGCASNQGVRGYAEKGDWQQAYEQFLASSKSASLSEQAKLIELANKYPEIGNYGFSTFSIDYLRYRASQMGSIDWPKSNIDRFCMIASAEQCGIAIDNIATVQASIKPDLKIIKSLSDGLSKDEIAKLSSKYTLVFLDDADVGIVMDRQVQNMSTAGSNAGTVVGAAAGSAAYNINSVSSSNPKNWTYSPAADLGSTILGAIIGSAANTPAVTSYMTRYTIKTRDGATKYEDRYSDTQIGQGVGVCVNTRSMEKIDQEFCTMDLAFLKQWVAKQD